ncbi:cadherin EGF LAG seven-pass G-type receptor 2 isoform X2 [Neoarius graeffei]|uniref:cadherin EGF LAG seven-pass G-type receptor 2 isoform X2 n=1 Tax=Neoarius graeffei TaxID=443677 RepID=UPI00298D4E5F|nr:cadherin EGF LAG seven-pass G-type receptor 2 isoform X2 [Neoarius graeffei]
MQWVLLFCVLARLNVPVRGFVVNLRADAKPGSTIARAEYRGSTCALHQVIAPRFTRGFLRTAPPAGTVSVSGSLPRCRALPLNPFPVYTVTDCASDALGFRHLLINQYHVRVHGKDCQSKPERRGSWDMEVITLLNLHDQETQCHEPGRALFHLQEVLPFHTGSDCHVSRTDFFVSEGELFVSEPLCLKHNSLLEFDLRCQGQAPNRAVSAHWHIGQGSFKQTYLERLLSKVAARSNSGFLSRKKRNAKTNTNPQFQPPMYQVSVPENKLAGTSVVTLRATDPDEGEAGRLEYSIEALFDSRSNNLFTVDPASGLVSTVEELDRETKDTHVFRVTAVDRGSPRRTAMATLTVTVSDTNDHNPMFEQQDYNESMRENLEIGYEVLTVRATDGDAPVNGNILYKILNSNGSNDVFEIDSRSGVIRIRGPVDRETVESYLLLVEANDQGRDPGPRSATATVHIVVEDDNDNAPQFSEKRYIVQVPEDLTPNTEILQVNATDQDRGSNAVVHFSIMSGNTRGQFYIDAQTGKLDLVSQLDYETNKEYTLRIRAQDGGRPPLSNISGLVTVQVLDVNDNAPIFVSTPFQATVLENVPLGYSVIHIQAVDADSGENSRLEYRLTETTPNFPFAINNSTGWIVVVTELDRESVDFYSFGVEAWDHGALVMSSSASISMTVLDVNDNNPEFTQKAYYMRLNEDATVGTSVVTVSAVDRDINSVVTYQLSSGNTRNRFSITSQSGGGLITLALPLDYKLERQYVLSVTASDGTRFDMAKVYINVTDANTHRPVFQSSHYTININEDRPVGTTVVVISATDEDTGENARITYDMEDSIPEFSIDTDSGAVTTQMELDYEDQVSYTLAIMARDNGIPQKSDTTYLEILVNDVNDNAPRFLRDRYLGSVMEDVPVYTSVVQVSATDQDSGLNGRVFYTFQGGDDGDGDFIIESTSGIVRTLRRLDRENTAVYNLQAFAVDKGLPALKTSVDIQVTILDVNDNPPVFEKDEFDIFVEENSPIGLVVAHISATDPDEGSNAQIMYQIVEGNIPEVFQLDIFSGELMALTDLDYEARSEYVIVVQATSAPLVSRATVHIRLVDRNDNAPVLKNFQIIFNNYVTEKSSSFPTGVIGKIPAHDPDVSDQLSYRFEAGNELHLLILNQTTGEIRLSQDLDNNRPLEASMRIAVSDGVHSVSAQCLLQVTIITDEMLSNSITLRLANTSQERFLSVLLSEFLEGVAHVLSTNRDDVIIFNVQDDTDVSAAILNVSLSVFRMGNGVRGRASRLVPVGAEFIGSEELQERLYLNRSLLAHISSQQVLPFDDNICLREPCENYMKCVSVLKFDSLAPFISSNTILFRPIQPITGLRCRCPPGFTGEFCETEIDLCYSNPCGNHGVCRSHEGGFTCECLDDYTGEWCVVSSRSGRCVPGVCKNGGVCVNLLVGGFRCECPPGAYEKPYCHMSTRSFPPNTFITFKGLRQRFHFTLTLSFATRELNGLLLYNGRFNEKHDFITMEIVNKQIQLTFSAGETKTTVSPFIPGGVSDGEWHSVHVHYYNKPALNQAGLPQGPSDQKVVVVTVDNCDMSVALRFGRTIGNYSCAAQGSQSGSKKSLDLTGPLLLGGVPHLPEDFPVHSRQFVGCMKDLHIDSRYIDMNSFIANNGTVPGCSAKRQMCVSSPCVNGGVCVSLWGSLKCDCLLGFGGRSCEKVMPNPQRFHGNGLLLWNDLDAMVTVPWRLELMFRTRQPTSTILHITTEQQHNLTVQLRDSSVLMSLYRGEDSAVSRLEEASVADGEWHHLQLKVRTSSRELATGPTVTLSLDHGLYMSSMEVDIEIQGAMVKVLSVGGVAVGNNKVHQGFRGCVQGVRVSDAVLSVFQAHRLNVEDGCSVSDPCASSPCPTHSSCTNHWDSYTCTCLPGYFGDNCTDVCTLNPCEHQSTCRKKSSSAHGYTCDCRSNYFGRYCEKKSGLTCHVLGVGGGTRHVVHVTVQLIRGLIPTATRPVESAAARITTTGRWAVMCVCCASVIPWARSRVCVTDRVGSVSVSRASSADSVTAVTIRLLRSQPMAVKATEGGIWWPRTKFGLPAAVPCPKGSTGTAIRHCDEHKGWLPPNLFNCTSILFTKLKLLWEQVNRDMSVLDSVKVQQAASLLYNATAHTHSYYGSDIQIAYRLTHALLQHESNTHGFNLAATQDVRFNQHLMHVCSAILASDTHHHWEQIQQTQGGTAALLQQFEAYTHTLAQNMRRTYLNPFTIITPNIVLSIDRLEKENFAGAKLPQYQSLRGLRPADLDTAIMLPSSIFSPTSEGKGHRHQGEPITELSRNHSANRKRRHPDEREQHAIASIVIFHTLATLLPERYDTDKRSLRVPKRPVINTPVISVMVFDNEQFIQHTLEKPVTLQFHLLTTEERSKPICVFWNHSIGVGGWSSKGCEVVFRNNTHISCQCYHMTSFAVLMDISHRENGEILPMSLVTMCTVSVTLGFIFLTVVFLTCLRDVTSNLSSIANNGASALFIAQLLFILGINQTDNPFVCTIMAILLQFFYMCVFSWLFLESLHVYRMLNEVRDINYGPMRFYYLIGWGVPAIITGLAVGLDPEGYGNPDFCWLSLYDTLVWSLAGPIALVVAMNVFLYILASRTSCSTKAHSCEKKETPVCGLRTACGVLFLVTVTCLLALLSVNTDLIVFHYLFAAFNCLQGPFIFFFRIVFCKEVRGAVQYCCGKKRPEHTIKPKPSSFSSSCVDGRVYHLSYSESSVSLNGTLQSIKSQHSYVPFILREDEGLNNSLDTLNIPENKDDSDSESDLSEMEDDQSGSFASTHSSDSEEEDEQYTPKEWWENHTHTSQREQDCDSGGGAKPKAETLTPPDERSENYGKESTLPLLLHKPHTHPHKGILKKKTLSPIAERNGIHRIHNQLSVSPSGSAFSRGPGTSIGSSPNQDQGGGAVQVWSNEVPTSVRTGVRDSDSSGSDHSCQTSM